MVRKRTREQIMEYLLRISNLTVEIGGQVILKDLNLDIEKNQNLILFGPNASGKSTLIAAIMGFESYKVTSGRIEFAGKNILELSPDERARLGIGMMFQNPPKIRGVRLEQLSGMLAEQSNTPKEKERLIKKLNLSYLLDRDLNVDLSGGEIKRSELLQVLVQKPKLLLLDEPESGVDLENIALMGEVLNTYLKSHQVSALIISHSGYILDYVDTKYGCVMFDGKINCRDNPKKIFANIKEFGYDKCQDCPDRKR